MARKTYIKKTLPVDSMIVTTKITAIEEIKYFDDGKVRSAYRCESHNGDDRLVIYWGLSCAAVGDVVHLKGRLKTDGTFLAWNILVTKQNEEAEVS